LLAPANAQHAADHKVYQPNGIKWSAAPPSVPKGAEIAVLYGDPSKEGLFAMRLKFPANYHIPPHTHPAPEVVTVISGKFLIGGGTTADKAKAEALTAGGLFAVPPGSPHFGYADGETVIQINSVGPWAIKYVNPEDDPRK
jgi:quercetin dioxygenase-like cupin family protein